MELSQLAVPCVYGLIFFLGYPSQWLLLQLEPSPLSKNELIISNIILLLIWITYTKSVFVDPGTIPKNWPELLHASTSPSTSTLTISEKEDDTPSAIKTKKYCTKCSAPKPPRTHHCKSCHRCIPKMDHHCPWTANCVSHTTFPHFLRFLFYTSLGLGLLEKFLFTRIMHLWTNRDMPSYLGPSVFQLALLTCLLLVNSITLFALGILCIRNIWCLAVNTTTIEGWEIERHNTLLRRARHFGGYLDAADGTQMRIKKQEFPYDIGIWKNIVQGMGSANPMSWFWPFSLTPSIESGLQFETNGFEDEGTSWPPPDPDRVYKRREKAVNKDAFTFQDSRLSREETVRAFQQRQEDDKLRRRKPFVVRLEERQRQMSDGLEDDGDYVYGDEASEEELEESTDYENRGNAGEESWRNSEGERLQDFGVDEDVEFYDERDDDIPLAELIARRKAAT